MAVRFQKSRDLACLVDVESAPPPDAAHAVVHVEFHPDGCRVADLVTHRLDHFAREPRTVDQ
ncbi:hypothetical protein ABW18_03360 [Gordonia jacobaea]|uniref:DUF2283 domain-containing protein n=1 Tax=Gordonia jacobaea TaxID=122202 RepID=A0ABR5IFJ2_9ACTN|nr:hypothetical protein ABW18_03360 [Gordonia jacobaea]